MSSLLLAASVTPLRDGGARVDEDAIEPLARFLVDRWRRTASSRSARPARACCSRLDERRAVAERFREARAGKLIVHCGAQSTADTVALAAHAAAIGADGVAVIPPPYYPLGDDALVAPLRRGRRGLRADAVLPVRVRRAQRLPAARGRGRSACASGPTNVAGLKVSEAPFERVEPYLELGLPVFVGAERLIPAGACGRRGRRRLRARVGVPRGRGRGGAPARRGRRHAAERAARRGRAAPVPELRSSRRCALAACRSRVTYAPRCRRSRPIRCVAVDARCARR